MVENILKQFYKWTILRLETFPTAFQLLGLSWQKAPATTFSSSQPSIYGPKATKEKNPSATTQESCKLCPRRRMDLFNKAQRPHSTIKENMRA